MWSSTQFTISCSAPALWLICCLLCRLWDTWEGPTYCRWSECRTRGVSLAGQPPCQKIRSRLWRIPHQSEMAGHCCPLCARWKLFKVTSYPILCLSLTQYIDFCEKYDLIFSLCKMRAICLCLLFLFYIFRRSYNPDEWKWVPLAYNRFNICPQYIIFKSTLEKSKLFTNSVWLQLIYPFFKTLNIFT